MMLPWCYLMSPQRRCWSAEGFKYLLPYFSPDEPVMPLPERRRRPRPVLGSVAVDACRLPCAEIVAVPAAAAPATAAPPAPPALLLSPAASERLATPPRVVPALLLLPRPAPVAPLAGRPFMTLAGGRGGGTGPTLTLTLTAFAAGAVLPSGGGVRGAGGGSFSFCFPTASCFPAETCFRPPPAARVVGLVAAGLALAPAFAPPAPLCRANSAPVAASMAGANGSVCSGGCCGFVHATRLAMLRNSSLQGSRDASHWQGKDQGTEMRKEGQAVQLDCPVTKQNFIVSARCASINMCRNKL